MGGGSGSNAGFVGLMTPMGQALLGFAFFLLIAIIMFGASMFKRGEQKAREDRHRMREEMERRARPE